MTKEAEILKRAVEIQEANVVICCTAEPTNEDLREIALLYGIEEDCINKAILFSYRGIRAGMSLSSLESAIDARLSCQSDVKTLSRTCSVSNVTYPGDPEPMDITAEVDEEKGIVSYIKVWKTHSPEINGPHWSENLLTAWEKEALSSNTQVPPQVNRDISSVYWAKGKGGGFAMLTMLDVPSISGKQVSLVELTDLESYFRARKARPQNNNSDFVL